MTTFATITSKYQLNIPVAVARLAGFVPGKQVLIRPEKGRVVVEDVGDFADLQGILASHPMSKKHSVLKIIEIAKKKEARRIANEAQIR